MSQGRVLLTGAFGNVGENTIIHLCAQGYEVFALDVRTKANRAKADRLRRRYPFETKWVDLRDAEMVKTAVAQIEPDAIAHVAAVIPPFAYRAPAVAHAVNVGGARNLVTASLAMARPPKFVNVSSYTVHGPRNPHRGGPPMDETTPLAPADNYARHKVEAESIVHGSGLDAVTLRFGVAVPTDPRWGTDPDFLRVNFLFPPDRNMHLIDSRDAALSVVNAIGVSTEGRRLLIGGDDSCKVTARAFSTRLLEARGLRPLSDRGFRMGHPDVDASWHGDGHMDSAPAQALLHFQQHTFDDYLAFVRRQAGLSRYAARIVDPLVRRWITSLSPLLDMDESVHARPQWDVACEVFDIPAEWR